MVKNIKVMITGVGGPAGMGSIKSLRKDSGLAVIGTDMNPLAPGLYWCDERAILPAVSAPEYMDRLLAAIEEHAADVLIPTVDEEISVLARNMDQLRKEVGIIISGEEANRICDDKLSVYQHLSKAGLPVVETRLVTSTDDALSFGSEFGYPFALKPQASRGGRGLHYCSDPDEAKKAFENLRDALPFNDTFYDEDKSRGIVCQEMLPGREYDVNHLRARDGEVLACVPMRADEWDVTHQHRTIVTEHSQDVMSTASDIAAALDLVGPLDIEMRYDRDGALKLLDLNPRVGGDVELATAAGCNIPRMVVDMALGKDVQRADFEDDVMLIRYLGIQTFKKSEVPKAE